MAKTRARIVDDRICVGDVVVVEGLRSGEVRPVSHWVQSRLDAGSSPQEIRAQLMGTTSHDPNAVETALDPSVLKGSVKAIKAVLTTGELDAHLDAVEDMERAGKARKGVLAALAARRGVA